MSESSGIDWDAVHREQATRTHRGYEPLKRPASRATLTPEERKKMSAVAKLVQATRAGHTVAGYVEPDGRVPAFGAQLSPEELQELLAAGILEPVTTPKGKRKHFNVDYEKARAAFGAPSASAADAPEAPKGRVSRTAAASHIADALEGAGFRAVAWTGGSAHRIYVKDSGGAHLGYLAITYEGSIEPHLDRKKGAVMAAVPPLEIEPLEKAGVAPRGSDQPPDDPMERMEWERRRAQGRTGELPGA